MYNNKMTEQMTKSGRWHVADEGCYLWYLYGFEYGKRVLLEKTEQSQCTKKSLKKN